VKRLAFVVGVVLLLLIGGGLTSQILVGGGNSLFLTQSAVPDASTLAAAPWQTEQLVILIGFILFNLIGIAVTLALVFWFLHRGVRSVRGEAGVQNTSGSAE
jgi:hypothetical protein